MYRAPASLLYVVYIIPTKVGLLTRLGPTEWTVNVRQDDVCLSGPSIRDHKFVRGNIGFKIG